MQQPGGAMQEKHSTRSTSSTPSTGPMELPYLSTRAMRVTSIGLPPTLASCSTLLPHFEPCWSSLKYCFLKPHKHRSMGVFKTRKTPFLFLGFRQNVKFPYWFCLNHKSSIWVLFKISSVAESW